MVFQETEVHLDSSCHNHGLAVLHTGPELPLADGLDCLLIERHPQASHYFDIARAAGGVHFYVENYCSLKLFLARFL